MMYVPRSMLRSKILMNQINLEGGSGKVAKVLETNAATI